MVHVQAETLGELALGLLDDDPAVECRLELLGEGLGAAHVPFLQQPDCGDVSQCLPDAQLGRPRSLSDFPSAVQLGSRPAIE